MLIGIAKVLGGIFLTGIGDGIAETTNGVAASSPENPSALRKAS
jgi:hypothetical protein